MRSGLAIEIRIRSKLCGPLTWPKMFINSFIKDPFRSPVMPAKAGTQGGSTESAALDPRFRGGDDQLEDIHHERRSIPTLFELDIEAERAQFLDQHIEGFGDAGFEIVVAADDRLIDFGAARDVVRLHRQHFLQGVRRTVSLQRPDLHLAKALAAELRLAAERLLRDEAVRADRARMDLVVDEVVQLHHI